MTNATLGKIKSNGRKHLPKAMPPEPAPVSEGEDTLDEGVSILIAETPEEEEIFELLGVPYLGRTRVRLLAQAGIRTLDDLRTASAGEIGGVKGVGLRNAERIKEWLASRPPYPALAPAPVPTASLDMELAEANQAVQDDMAQINTAVSRIQGAIPARIAHNKLDRQMDKLLAILSELAEGPDTLRPKQFRRALKMLHLIASLLDKFAGVGHLSEKIVVAFAEELRDRRKRLQKILDTSS